MKFKKNFVIGLLPVCFLFSSVAQSDSATVVNLQNKSLTRVPEGIPYASLKSLNLSYNIIQRLPAEIQKATALESLDLGNNKLLDFGNTCQVLKQLQIKNLSADECNLLYFPLELTEINSVQALSLNKNYIGELPAEISKLTSLRDLILESNKLSELPASFESLLALHTLNISGNECINKTKTFATLSRLPSLNALVAREATILDPAIFSLPQLTSLDISNGNFQTVNLKNNIKCNLVSFFATACNQADFTLFNPVLKSATLKELHLGGDKFNGFNATDLAAGIETLKLSGVNLDYFEPLTKLQNLSSVELNFEKINCQEKFISFLEQCGSVKHLSVSGCGLTILPHRMGNLTTLESLDISGNKINNIHTLFPLKQLVELNISGCQLNQNQVQKLKDNLPNTKIINDINPALPIAGTGNNKENFVIDPAKPAPVITANGTQIIIPPNSLEFANGKPVNGPVSLNYNSFYTLGSIAASGINMNYEENGKLLPFKSAGMFNLTASAEGKPVELKKGKEITVRFKSLDSTQSYNYYVYDTLTQTWKETGKDSLKKIKVSKKELTNKTDSLASVFINSNLAPRKSRFITHKAIKMKWKLKGDHRGQFTISTEINKKHLLDSSTAHNYLFEIEELSKVKWMVEGEDFKTIRKKIFDHPNNKLFRTYGEKKLLQFGYEYKVAETRRDTEVYINILPDAEHDNFIIIFCSEFDTVKFNAYPDISSRNIQRVQQKTKMIYDRFQKQKSLREKITTYRKNRFYREYRKFVINARNTQQTMWAANQKSIGELLSSKVNSDSYDITRLLTLKGFGIHNCDHPLPVDNPILLAFNYFNENGHRIQGHTAKFIDVKNNVATSVYQNTKGQVPLNTLLTVVLSSNNHTYLGKFSTVGLSGKNKTADVKLSKAPVNFTIADLDNYINTFN